ncbi:hypothetical protein HZ994_02465 [Akkermansiaceae bacterium]|nr:hypothetical protein HZ994_02465 [Akkermansiaceae bacterium]
MKPSALPGSSPHRSRPWLWLSVVLAIVCGGVGAIWFASRTPDLEPLAVAIKSLPRAVPVPDMQEPAEDFGTFLHVLRTGGNEVTKPVAIAWLDKVARENIALTKSEREGVMGMIRSGGHQSWESGYRLHLFNSAFNAMQLRHPFGEFTEELLRLATRDPNRTMRLYALQHLNLQRRTGRLPDGALADEVLAAVRGMSSDNGVAGYVIEILATWDGGEDAEPTPEILRIALSTAADPSFPTDVRVTAIHAAGSASVPLARTIATDAGEHTMLRKAAIALIGRYGSPADLGFLETIRSESARLAQAAEPAIARLRERPDGRGEPIPYQ